MSRAVMQQALEALMQWEDEAPHAWSKADEEAVAALRAALAEPEQEPSGSFVLWENTLCNPLSDPRSMAHSAWHDGYASAKVERKPLSEDEIVRLMVGEDRAKLLSAGEFAEGAVRELVESGRAIERAHGIGAQNGS